MLHAVRFDAARQEVSGDPVRLVEGVQTVTTAGSAEAPDFSLSRTGTLVYAPASEGTSRPRTLVWVDRQGHEELIAAPPRFYQIGSSFARRDANRCRPFAVRERTCGSGTSPGKRWVGSRSMRGLMLPVVVSRRARIAYTSVATCVWRLADGNGIAEAVSDRPGSARAESFSPDGSQLVVLEFNPKTLGDLMLVRPDTKGEAAPLLRTPSEEAWPRSLPMAGG